MPTATCYYPIRASEGASDQLLGGAWLVKNHWFVWRAKSWPLVRDTVLIRSLYSLFQKSGGGAESINSTFPPWYLQYLVSLFLGDLRLEVRERKTYQKWHCFSPSLSTFSCCVDSSWLSAHWHFFTILFFVFELVLFVTIWEDLRMWFFTEYCSHPRGLLLLQKKDPSFETFKVGFERIFVT